MEGRVWLAGILLLAAAFRVRSLVDNRSTVLPRRVEYAELETTMKKTERILAAILGMTPLLVGAEEDCGGPPKGASTPCPQGGTMSLWGSADGGEKVVDYETMETELVIFEANNNAEYEDCGVRGVRIDGEISVTAVKQNDGKRKYTSRYSGSLRFSGETSGACNVDIELTTSAERPAGVLSPDWPGHRSDLELGLEMAAEGAGSCGYNLDDVLDDFE